MAKSAESSNVANLNAHDPGSGSDVGALEGWSLEAPHSTTRPKAPSGVRDIGADDASSPGSSPISVVAEIVADSSQRRAHDESGVDNDGSEPRWMRDLRSFVSAKRAAIGADDVEARADAPLARESFRRIGAPVFSRPAGLRLFSRTTRRMDASIPRLRIYTDDAFSIGGRLRLDVYVEGRTYKINVEVAWLDPLPEKAPARFDMGLFVNDAEPDSVTAILKVLRT